MAGSDGAYITDTDTDNGIPEYGACITDTDIKNSVLASIDSVNWVSQEKE